MIVDRQTRLLAMYWVYRNTRMVDCFVGSEELEQRWRKTGLRREDLLSALHDMTARGFLTTIHNETSASYRLTQAGLAEFRMSRIALVYALAHWLTLLRTLARRLWAPGAPAGPRPPADRRRPRASVDLHQCSGPS